MSNTVDLIRVEKFVFQPVLVVTSGEVISTGQAKSSTGKKASHLSSLI